MLTAELAFVLGLAAVALMGLVFGPVTVAGRLRPDPPPVVGPLFRVELRRLSRQGTQLRLRTVYSLFLLAGLLVAYLREFPEVSPLDLLVGGKVPRDRVANLGETFFFIFVLLQLVGLTLVTPVFAGAAVFEERDRGTLELLRSSMLSDREIVTGKLAARVAFVLMLTLTGLPILAVSMTLGGIDGERLVCAFVVCVFHTISLAVYSFWCATLSTSWNSVLGEAFGGVMKLFAVGSATQFFFTGFAGLSPFSWLTMAFALIRPGGAPPVIGSTLVTIGFHSAFAAFFGLRAIGRLRDLRQARTVTAANTAPNLGRLFPIPPVDDEAPLLWKEAHFTLQARWNPKFTAGCLVTLLVIALPIVLIGVLNRLFWEQKVSEALVLLFRGESILLLAFAIPFVGLVLVGSVARERQRQTLDSLFALPSDRTDILHAKWQAANGFLKPVWLTYAVSVATMILALAVPILSAVVMAVLFAAAVLFFLTLALWLSVRCRTVVRASVWYLGLLLGVYVLPLLASVPAARLAANFGWSPAFVELFAASFSPAFASWSVIVTWEASEATNEWRACAVAALATSVTMLFAVVLLWYNARRTFEREGWS